MTDQPDQHPSNTTEPIEPTAAPKPSRWERLRPRSRLSQIAVAVAAAAAACFVAAAIFATGFALGSGGDEHHRHGGDGSRHSSEAERHGQWNGSGHDGEDGHHG
jgi:hypothetical protein